MSLNDAWTGKQKYYGFVVWSMTLRDKSLGASLHCCKLTKAGCMYMGVVELWCFMVSCLDMFVCLSYPSLESGTHVYGCSWVMMLYVLMLRCAYMPRFLYYRGWDTSCNVQDIN
jgi:hypothetical protein